MINKYESKAKDGLGHLIDGKELSDIENYIDALEGQLEDAQSEITELRAELGRGSPSK